MRFSDLCPVISAQRPDFSLAACRGWRTGCAKLWRETGIRVLPGAYLARDTPDGTGRFIRVALVAPKSITEQALTRLHACLYT